MSMTTDDVTDFLTDDDFGFDVLSPRRLGHGEVQAVPPFGDVVGQKRAVELLDQLAEGLKCGLVAPAMCLIGPSGRGKTTLATEFARVVGRPCVMVACGREITAVELISTITRHDEATVFFLDEIHSLSRRCQELLFTAIDCAQVPRIKRGSLDRMAPPVNTESHLWIGATNLPGKLLTALRSRMLPVHLVDYTQDELIVMAERLAVRHELVADAESLKTLACACGGSPRLLGQIVETLAIATVVDRYEAARGGAEYIVDQPTTEKVLTMMGIDRRGLDTADRLVIAAIRSQPRGSASAEMLAVAAGLDVGFIRERLVHLRCRGLLAAATGRGWSLTPEGLGIAAMLDPTTSDASHSPSP